MTTHTPTCPHCQTPMHIGQAIVQTKRGVA